MEGTGTIASLRHPMPFSSYALRVGANGWMPTLSDPACPLCGMAYPQGLASTFERYQTVTV